MVVYIMPRTIIKNLEINKIIKFKILKSLMTSLTKSAAISLNLLTFRREIWSKVHAQLHKEALLMYYQ